MATSSQEITKAFWALGDHFSRLGGAARYPNMDESDVPLYIGCQLAGKSSPSFPVPDLVSAQFLEAAAPVLKEVHAHLSAVTDRPEELAVLLPQFVDYANSRLKAEDRSNRWERFVKWVNQSLASSIVPVKAPKAKGE